MVVTINGNKYIVQGEVGRLVKEAQEYRRISGKTPAELDAWIEEILVMQDRLISKVDKVLKELGINP